METLHFYDFEDFAFDIVDKYDSAIDLREDEATVSIVAKYDESKRIIEELISLGYGIRNIEIADEFLNNYADEFIISIYDDEIWCEPMKRENGYLNDESTVIFILDNCSSKVLSHCFGLSMYEVSVDETKEFEDDFDDEYDDDFNDGISIDCCDCVDEDCPNRCEKGYKNKIDVKNSDEKADDSMYVEYSKDDDGDLHGFTASKSDGNKYIGYSVYTTDKLSKRDIQSLLHEARF